MQLSRVIRYVVGIFIIYTIGAEDWVERHSNGDIYSSVDCQETACVCTPVTPTRISRENSSSLCIKEYWEGGIGCRLKMSNVMDVAFVSKGNVSTTIYEISKENDAVLCEEDEVTTVATFVWGTGSGWIFADAIKDVIADETDGGKKIDIVFNKLWDGMLMKLQVFCKKEDKSSHSPSGYCVLAKHEGRTKDPIDRTTVQKETAPTAIVTVPLNTETSPVTTIVTGIKTTTTSSSTHPTTATTSSMSSQAPTTSTTSAEIPQPTTTRITTTIFTTTSIESIATTQTSTNTSRPPSTTFGSSTITPNTTIAAKASAYSDVVEIPLIIGCIGAGIILLIVVLIIIIRKCRSTKSSEQSNTEPVHTPYYTSSEDFANPSYDRRLPIEDPQVQNIDEYPQYIKLGEMHDGRFHNNNQVPIYINYDPNNPENQLGEVNLSYNDESIVPIHTSSNVLDSESVASSSPGRGYNDRTLLHNQPHPIAPPRPPIVPRTELPSREPYHESYDEYDDDNDDIGDPRNLKETNNSNLVPMDYNGPTNEPTTTTNQINISDLYATVDKSRNYPQY